MSKAVLHPLVVCMSILVLEYLCVKTSQNLLSLPLDLVFPAVIFLLALVQTSGHDSQELSLSVCVNIQCMHILDAVIVDKLNRNSGAQCVFMGCINVQH